MLKIFGINIKSTHISKLYILFPIMLYSEHLKSPFGGYPVIDKGVEQNISLEEINREISSHYSVDKNVTTYKYKDIVNLRNKLDSYLDTSNHSKYIDNSIIIVDRDVLIDTSEIINSVNRVNSVMENSNIGVIIEQDIDNTIIENDVNVINSNINNSNLGIEIRRNNSDVHNQDKIESNTISNTFNSINSNISSKNINNGISIGN